MITPSVYKSILYFSPHQDDELLVMGTGILADLRDGFDVHVILCSDGSRSRVREKIGLSERDFIKSRDTEFTESCLSLGIDKGNIHLPAGRMTDRSMSIAGCRQLICDHLWKNCIVCTIFPLSNPLQHPDHRSIGEAAMELFEERTIEELKLFTEPWLKDDREYFECVCSQQELERIKNAAEAYTRTDPDHSRYGIGKSSVSKHFVALNKEAVSYYQHFR